MCAPEQFLERQLSPMSNGSNDKLTETIAVMALTFCIDCVSNSFRTICYDLNIV